MPFGFAGDLPPPPPMPRRGDNRFPPPPPPPPPPAGAMGFHSPPPPFRDRRDDPFNPLELPAFFQPDFDATMRHRIRRMRTMPANDEVNRNAQEEADAALARQLQEQELGTDIGRLNLDDDDEFGYSDRRQRARRARRRVYTVTEGNDVYPLDEGDDSAGMAR